MTGVAVILIGILLTAATIRLASGHWMPVRSEHVPLNLAALTINNIPIEVLYSPDAVRHPYPLSEPADFLLTERPLFQPPQDTFRADMHAFRIAERLRAETAKPGDLFRHFNPS